MGRRSLRDRDLPVASPARILREICRGARGGPGTAPGHGDPGARGNRLYNHAERAMSHDEPGTRRGVAAWALPLLTISFVAAGCAGHFSACPSAGGSPWRELS